LQTELRKKGELSVLTDIHGRFHEALLPGGKFSKKLLLSLSGPLTSERKKREMIFDEYATTSKYLNNCRYPVHSSASPLSIK